MNSFPAIAHRLGISAQGANAGRSSETIGF